MEAHLFDFDGDLYDRRIVVEFFAKLREELKFDDLATMVEQIHRDAADARLALARHALASPQISPFLFPVRAFPAP